MKRLIACVSLVAVATTAAPASTAPGKPAPKAAAAKTIAHAKKCRVAPADEYFGKLKMSILGIRNTIKDQGLKVDVYPEKAPSTLGTIALAEDALRDWQHKYPCDNWLPGTIYALEHFYGKLHTEDGVRHVHATFAWLRRDFPRSSFVSVALKENAHASVAPPIPAVTEAISATPAPAPPQSPGNM